jgi:hypothetical protein
MKAEFSDAYRMRNSVLVAILTCVVLASLGIVYGVVGFMGWVRYLWTNWAAIGTPSRLHINRENVIMYGEHLPRDGL